MPQQSVYFRGGGGNHSMKLHEITATKMVAVLLQEDGFIVFAFVVLEGMLFSYEAKATQLFGIAPPCLKLWQTSVTLRM